MTYLRQRLVAIGAAVALLAVVFAGGLGGRAQEAQSPGGITTPPRPAHIHEGTCETLNPTPLFPLNDVIFRGAASAATPGASPVAAAAGSASAIPVAVSVTVVQAPLTTILGAQHAINVHESAENPGNYIACGTITGTPDADGGIYIGLAEQNGSGFSGTAWLLDNGDGTTTVTVFLAENLASALQGGGTPVASPAA